MSGADESDDLITVRVLLFAKAREVFGAKETEVRVRAQSSPQHILETLQESCPQMADIAASLMVSHNQEYVDMDSSLTLRNRDEIGIIPPLSGG